LDRSFLDGLSIIAKLNERGSGNGEDGNDEEDEEVDLDLAVQSE